MGSYSTVLLDNEPCALLLRTAARMGRLCGARVLLGDEVAATLPMESSLSVEAEAEEVELEVEVTTVLVLTKAALPTAQHSNCFPKALRTDEC